MSRFPLLLLTAAALLLVAPDTGCAQTATMDGFGRGSGSLTDVLRGTHSQGGVSQPGSVRERVQGMRRTLRQPATRAAGNAARGGLWRAIGGAVARTAPIAGAAALADSPVLPIGDLIGLGIIAVAVGSEVYSYMREGDAADARDQPTTTTADQQCLDTPDAPEFADRVVPTFSRGQAIRRAQAFAEVARDGRGGVDIPLGDLNGSSRGANFGRLAEQGVRRLGRRDTVHGGSWFEHPDGHPHQCGPNDPSHHGRPHVHATNRHGETAIFTYPR